MYGIDIVSGYAVCGAGCLAGAGMLALLRPESPRTVLALRLFIAAFACTGAGLLTFLLSYDLPLSWISHSYACLCAVGLTLSGWALREFNGYRTAPRTGWMCTGATLLVMLVSWASFSDLGFGVAYCALCLLIGSAICATQWQFFMTARQPAELALAVTMGMFAVVTLVRTCFTLVYRGPALIHHLYVPEEWASAFMLAYAVMPMLAAAALMVSVNCRLMQQLERRAQTDEMTGLASRQGLRELGPRVLQRATDRLQDVAVVMLDIDRFKRVNEEHGALVGDDVLRHLSRLFKQVLRSDALLARYGGEEFVLLVPLDHAAMASHVAERLRMAVEKHSCHTAGLAVTVTASVGLTLHRTGELLDKALMRADRLLYQAKASGRNCICDDLNGPMELDAPIDLSAPSDAAEATVVMPRPTPGLAPQPASA
jgi:diguanylate cyclase (GGDEF)-like protein